MIFSGKKRSRDNDLEYSISSEGTEKTINDNFSENFEIGFNNAFNYEEDVSKNRTESTSLEHYFINLNYIKPIFQITKKLSRKYRDDDIKKKLKAHFHKDIKEEINGRLREAGSIQIFEDFPQPFIANISIELNKKAMGLTYRQLIEKDYFSSIEQSKYQKQLPAAMNKFRHNLMVLSYLDENPEILKSSGINYILNSLYSNLLKDYFDQEKFIKNGNSLTNEETYFKEVKRNAKEYVNFFFKQPIRKRKKFSKMS